MLLVDSRAGSQELTKPLQQLGLDVCETVLDFGDVAFVGRGAKGVSVDIGVEYKQIGELIQSLRSGRLAGHQLLGMRPAYEHSWLLIEGIWKADPKSGLICTERYVASKRRKMWVPLPGRMTLSELEKQLLTLEFCGGMRARFADTQEDTLRFLLTLYRWWTDEDLDKHRSHLAIYHAPTLTPVSDFRRIIHGIPGVGFRASLAAEKQFKTVRRAMRASIQEWAELTTLDDKGKPKRLGEKVAGRIDKILG